MNRYSYFRLWIAGWADLISGLCCILTLGRWRTMLPLRAQAAVLRSARVRKPVQIDYDVTKP